MTEPDPRISRYADRTVRMLLKAYPRRFRRRFGQGIRYAWLGDYLKAREAGRLAPALFWIRTGTSALINGALERVRSLSARRTPRGPEGPPPRVIEQREGIGMERFMREIAFALRRLVRRPGFTVAAAGTLALGIAATTAIFSVVNSVILRPLPYPDADRVVRVGHRSSTGALAMPDGAYFYFAEHATTLETLAAYIETSATIAGMGEPLELGIIRTTPSLFRVLGVTPFMGRALTDEDAAEGADPVTVVSHGYWQRQLGADPEAVGKPVLEGASIIVVGVLPRGFEFPRPRATFVFGNRFEGPDIYLPMRLNETSARYGNFMYQGLGRLTPGGTPAEAQLELTRLMPRAAETYTGTIGGGSFSPDELREGGYFPEVATAKDAIVGDVARVLWILLGAVGLVLLIATANVANLFLVRAEARRGDIAVQRALGADRWSLTRSFLSESAILTLLGGGLGIMLARLAVVGLVRLAPSDVPRLEEVGLDLLVLGFAAGVSILAGLTFGMAPLFRASRLEVGSELASTTRSGFEGRGRRRGQDALVVLQVALALVLLMGSGLLLRTFQNLRAVQPGFEPANVLTLRLALGENLVRGAGYDDGPDDAVRSRFMIDVVSRLQALPGVEAAAYTGDLPLDRDERYDYVVVEDRTLPENLTGATKALRVFIGPGYLQAIGARLRSGRELEAIEFADQPRSAVVNETFAEQLWPGEDPVGKRLLQYWEGVDPDQDVWYTVVGVVEDIREKSLMSRSEPTVYLPTVFLPEGGFGMPVSNFVAVLRTEGTPEAMIPRVRDAIAEVHPEIPINNVETLEHLTARSFEDITFAMILLLTAGAASAALGLVGIYGTVAYVVGRRTREFGLRIALGASAATVRWGVLRGAARVGAVGIGLGIVGALASGRVLQSLLFGVSATDPLVGTGVATTIFLLVLAASLVPAFRASSVNPVEAMRVE